MRKLKYKPRYCPTCGEPFKEQDITENLNKYQFVCACQNCVPGAIIITVIVGKEMR